MESKPNGEQSNIGSITMERIKRFGFAGTLSYVVTEVAFWVVALPGAIFTYHQSTGEWLSWETDRAQLVGIAAAFVSGVRLAVPLRMGVAFALIPTVQRMLDRFSSGTPNVEQEEAGGSSKGDQQ